MTTDPNQRIPLYGCKDGMVLRTPKGSRIIEGDAAGILLSYMDTMDAVRAEMQAAIDYHATSGEAMAALRELVEVKALHDQHEALVRVREDGVTIDDQACLALHAEYQRRKPLAWAAARAALAVVGKQTGGEGRT